MFTSQLLLIAELAEFASVSFLSIDSLESFLSSVDKPLYLLQLATKGAPRRLHQADTQTRVPGRATLLANLRQELLTLFSVDRYNSVGILFEFRRSGCSGSLPVESFAVG